MDRPRLPFFVVLSSVITLAFSPTELLAAGFMLTEQGVKGLGNAYAGRTASAEDAATVFENPAAMTLLSGRHVTVAAHVIVPKSTFSDGGSTISPALGGAPLTGGNGGDAGEDAVVPTFYYTQELPRGFRFGLAINAPFGLATEYDGDWQGRYQAVRSEIMTININPAIAFKASDTLSLGFGVNYMYIDAELTQAVDFSVACLGTFSPGACAAAGLATPQNPSTDGFSRNTADDSSWGYNLGLLYEFSPQTRVGVAYRSKVKHALEGDGDFTLPAAVSGGASAEAATLRAVFADSPITANVNLPETITASLYHRLNPKWAVLGDISRIHWSRIQELRIDFANPAKSDGVEPLNWENTWRYSVGLTHYRDSHWTLRGGIAFDETPIPNAASRTPRLPGSERTWLAAGASYTRSQNFSFDISYAHLFMKDAPINRTGALGDILVGSYKNKVDILSAQLNWKFR
jgi:long-chain fatty acid transport protein